MRVKLYPDIGDLVEAQVQKAVAMVRGFSGDYVKVEWANYQPTHSLINRNYFISDGAYYSEKLGRWIIP